LALIAELTAEYGPIVFHQSGGCCDGSSPMCYPAGEFIVGDQDVKLGEIGGAAFYIGAAQYEAPHGAHHRCRKGAERDVLSRQRPRAPIPDAIGGVQGLAAWAPFGSVERNIFV